MKHTKLLTAFVLPFMTIGCYSAKQRNLYQGEVEINMVTMFGDSMGQSEYKDKFVYNDDWFFKKNQELNNELALASAMTSAASYSNELDNNGTKISNFLATVGYSNIQKNHYYENGVKLTDSIGAVIGSKKVKDKKGKAYTLLAIFPRNAGYDAEWAGNFNISENGTHQGFMLARDELLRFTKQYITTNEISGPLKVWTAGYSRGAATVNLFSAFLADGASYFGTDVSLNSSNIYSYTFGTPSAASTSMSKSAFLSVSGPRGEGWYDTNIPAYTYTGSTEKVNPADEKYNYIHNLVAAGDYVSKLPPASYGFARFGKTEELVFGSDKMLEYLNVLSPETAEMFEDGRNYVTKEPTSTFDFDTIDIVDTQTLKSPNEILDERIKAITDLVPTVAEYVNGGYNDALGAIVTAFGCDYSGISEAASSVGTSGLIKTAALAYVANAVKRLGGTDSEGIASIAMQLMGLLGKPVANPDEYSDQAFLKDLLDLIINDYQTSETAKVRLTKICFLIPDPYGKLILDVVEYAKDKEMTASTVDDLLYIIASYYNDHQDDEAMLQIIDMLASQIPESYVMFLPMLTGKTYDDEHYPTTHDKAVAAVKDLIIECVLGRPDAEISAAGFRYTILSMVPMFLPKSCPKLSNLVVNGATDTDGEKIVKEPAKLAELADEILELAMPVNEETKKRKTFEELANEELISLLEKCKTDITSKYVDTVIEKLDITKDMLIAFVFNPGSTYSLASDIENALTFYKAITFLAPAHFIDLYTCFLKAQINTK